MQNFSEKGLTFPKEYAKIIIFSAENLNFLKAFYPMQRVQLLPNMQVQVLLLPVAKQ